MKQKTDIERLFRAHYEKMYNLARCMLYDDDECKDVVSEVFSKIIVDNVTLLSDSEEAYLMRCVRNACLNVIARQGTKEKVVKLLIDENDDYILDNDDERLSLLMGIIDRLEPPLRRMILRLRFLQEMSYQEIAEHEGVSKVTVYNHLSKAVDFIREQFNKARQ